MNTNQTELPNYDSPLPTERERAYTQTITGTELEVRTMDLIPRIIYAVVVLCAIVTGVLAIYGGIRLIDKVM